MGEAVAGSIVCSVVPACHTYGDAHQGRLVERIVDPIEGAIRPCSRLLEIPPAQPRSSRDG
jgi:hypothetical protein